MPAVQALPGGEPVGSWPACRPSRQQARSRRCRSMWFLRPLGVFWYWLPDLRTDSARTCSRQGSQYRRPPRHRVQTKTHWWHRAHSNSHTYKATGASPGDPAKSWTRRGTCTTNQTSLKRGGSPRPWQSPEYELGLCLTPGPTRRPYRSMRCSAIFRPGHAADDAGANTDRKMGWPTIPRSRQALDRGQW